MRPALLILLFAFPAGTADAPDCIWLGMDRFAERYNEFAAGMNAGLFDWSAARDLSRRWDRLEACEGWPK